jgi:hypothetical protein
MVRATARCVEVRAADRGAAWTPDRHVTPGGRGVAAQDATVAVPPATRDMVAQGTQTKYEQDPYACTNVARVKQQVSPSDPARAPAVV